jgi:hypothetical protein
MAGQRRDVHVADYFDFYQPERNAIQRLLEDGRTRLPWGDLIAMRPATRPHTPLGRRVPCPGTTQRRHCVLRRYRAWRDMVRGV